MVETCLSLGSNLGRRRATLGDALIAIDGLEGATLLAVSSLYETEPWGDEDQAHFLNVTAVVQTSQSADAFLQELQSIENQLGRQRDPARRWGPRAIDIDILVFGEERWAQPELTLPHPRMHERAFVLVPLQELRPELALDGRGSVEDLARSAGTDGIEKISGPGWFKHYLGKK